MSESYELLYASYLAELGMKYRITHNFQTSELSTMDT